MATWTLQFKIVNSQGDITGIGSFATQAEALIWITANGVPGHDYFVIPYYTYI